MTLEEYMNSLGLDEGTYKELFPLLKKVEYHVGDTVLNMGENTQVVCLILKGIVRGFYLDENGDDVTKCFSKEGDWCCFYNFIENTPSQYYIEALEECTMAQISVDTLRTVIEKYPPLQRVYNELAKNAFVMAEEKNASFLKMDAKQRYLTFVEKNPEIAGRVKQEYIASYLGITPSSLSRIKRSL